MIGRLRLPRLPDQPALLHYVPAVILALFGLPLMAGAISLLVGAGGGLYWFVPAVVLGFAGCPQRMGAAHRDSALALG